MKRKMCFPVLLFLLVQASHLETQTFNTIGNSSITCFVDSAQALTNNDTFGIDPNNGKKDYELVAEPITYPTYPRTILNQAVSPAADTSALTDRVAALFEDYEIPGLSVCIVKDGQVFWSGNFGLANIEEEIPMSDSIIFLTASLSKTFVGVALMQLWEEDLFELDDDINDFLPFTVSNPYFPEETISFRMLMAHTSSIQDNWDVLESQPVLMWGEDSPLSLAEFMRAYFSTDGTHYTEENFNDWSPGTSFAYSNVATALAGYLVEVISGEPLEEYCRDSIWLALEMNNTSWFLSSFDTAELMMPYRTYLVPNPIPYGHCHQAWYPACCLRTSIEQLAHFLVCFMHKGELDGARILDSTTVDIMTTVQYPDFPGYPGAEWGLDWYRIQAGDFTVWGHTGSYYGVNSAMHYRQDEDVGVILFYNGQNTDPRTDLAGILFDLVSDSDGDGFVSIFDNCPDVFNPDQTEVERGDINCEGGIDVLDVLIVVNHILGLAPLSGQPLDRADCNRNESVDVLDVFGIVNVILGIGECAPSFKPIVNSEVVHYCQSLKPYLSNGDYDRFIALVRNEMFTPTENVLSQNYPNPCNPTTAIHYTLPGKGETENGERPLLHTTLKIYNILGQEVRMLVDEVQEAGYYTVTWDGTDNRGLRVSSGVYHYRLEVGNFRSTRKMLLLK